MNRDYFRHMGHSQASPEPYDQATATSPPVPGMPRSNASNYPTSGYPAANALTSGSLRSTRSTQANAAYARPQGSLRRNGYHPHEANAHTAAGYEDSRYNAPNLQPFVPDASERRGTPEYYGSNNSNAQTIDYNYRRNNHSYQQPPLPSPIKTHGSGYNMPARSASGARRYSRDHDDDAKSNRSSGDFSRHAALLGNARLVSGRIDREPSAEVLPLSSHRVEFGSTNPAKASFSSSPSPERDEIADIIADMSTARITSGDDNDLEDNDSSDALFIGKKSPVHVFLQLGDSTKRVVLTERPSQTNLINLFIEKYRDRLAENPESLPTIYINDAKNRDLFYELEDMADVVDGSILSWRTLPLSSASNVAKSLDDDSKSAATLRSEVGDLASVVRSLAETVAQIPAQIKSELASAVGEVKDHTNVTIGSIKALPAVTSPSGGASLDKPAIARSASAPMISSAEIDELHARVQRLELALSVERQERREEAVAAERAKVEAVKELDKLKESASCHPNVLRVRIEEGKDMLKNDYRQLNTRFEDVHALVQEMRKDVAQRGSIPSSQMMRKATVDLKGIESGTERLVSFINETRSDWKRTWEEELQNILKEQSFVKDVEQMLGELSDDTQHLSDVIDKLNKIIDLKLRERAKDDYVPSAATKFFDVVSPDDAPDAKKDFLMQISCVDVDHQRRLDALKTAERIRQTELATKVNEFDEELSDFVTQRKLRKTGGTEELERRRAEKEIEVMKDMLKSVEEDAQARRAKVAQRKAASKKQTT
ncbi:Bud site selection protein 6 [Coemansia sp. S3946]|nr:Bud site selection protein 6 [Coemansia sp. S3946]